MTLKELKIELIKKEKTMTWLGNQLGCSSSWVYQIIDQQRAEDIKRIKKILEEIE